MVKYWTFLSRFSFISFLSFTGRKRLPWDGLPEQTAIQPLYWHMYYMQSAGKEHLNLSWKFTFLKLETWEKQASFLIHVLTFSGVNCFLYLSCFPAWVLAFKSSSNSKVYNFTMIFHPLSGKLLQCLFLTGPVAWLSLMLLTVLSSTCRAGEPPAVQDGC